MLDASSARVLVVAIFGEDLCPPDPAAAVFQLLIVSVAYTNVIVALKVSAGFS